MWSNGNSLSDGPSLLEPWYFRVMRANQDRGPV